MSSAREGAGPERSAEDHEHVSGGPVHSIDAHTRGSGERLARWVLAIPAMSMLLYGVVAMTLNSRLSSPLVDLIIGWRFSGELSWERSSWGPEPWDVRLLNAALTDATASDVVRIDSVEVDDYLYQGLLEDHISLLSARVVRPRVKLKERAHLFQHRRLEWDIAELFHPPHPKLDDGEPLPPITIDILDLNIEEGEVALEMAVTAQEAHKVQVRGGRFGFDLLRKHIYMGAQALTVEEGRSSVWVRDLKTLKPADRIFKEHTAPVELSLEYPISDLEVSSFWWVGDQFGASQLKGSLYQADQVALQDVMLSLVKGGTPELSGRVSAEIRSTAAYVAPWGLGELIKGELSLSAELYGPVSDPCARDLELSGQLFLPVLSSTLFKLSGAKNRANQLTLSSLRVWSGIGDVEASGDLNLDSKRGLFQLQLKGVEWAGLTQVPLAWSAWGVEAQGGLTLKVRPHSAHDLELGLELISSLEGPAPLDLDARATLTGSRLMVHYAKARLGPPSSARGRAKVGGASSLTLISRGELDFDKHIIDAELDAQAQLAPNMLPPLKLPLSGAVKVSLKASGPLDAPRVEGGLTGRSLRGRSAGYSWALSRVKLPFKLNSERLTLKPFSLKGRSIDLEGSLKIPLDHPDRLQGWTFMHQLPLDLSPSGVPVSAQLNGVACTEGDGCAAYFKRNPMARRAKEDSCLKNLIDRQGGPQNSPPEGITALELCLTGKDVKYQQFSLNEMAVSGRWDSARREAILRRVRMWKGPRLLLDAEGQLDLTAGQFQSEAKLLDFPLQLIQLFTPDPPPELKTLYGLVEGDFTLGGSLSRPVGQGELTVKRVSLKLSQMSPPLPVQLGLAALKFNLSLTGLDAEGHIGRQLWLRASIPFGERGEQAARVGLDFYELPVSFLSATPQGEQGYGAQLKTLKSGLVESVGLAPLSFSDPDEELTALTLGQEGYCALTALKLPSSTLSMISLQGHLDLSFPLNKAQVRPSVTADFDGLKLEHWIRDSLGVLVKLDPAKGAERNSCHLLCGAPQRCPTLALNNENPAHLELRSEAQIADRVYLNPSPSLDIPKDSTGELWVTGWRAEEHVRLDPFYLSGLHQRLALRLGLVDQQLSAALDGDSQFSTLGLFLDGLFQRLEGQLSAQVVARGPLSDPSLEGLIKLKNIALLSPRSQVIGDIRLTSPLSLDLAPIEEGGLQVSLSKGSAVKLLRNEGEVTLNELNVSLPKLSFKRLEVGFQAQQLEAKLPDFGRFTTQLKRMRFVMDSSLSTVSPDLLLEGEVDILRALYTADVVSTDEINQGFRNNFTGRTAVETLSVFDRSPILKRLRLNLNVSGEDDLLVRNEVGGVVKLNLGVSLKLNIKGYLYDRPSDPLDRRLQLSGEVNTLDGSTITYLNNTFDVENGRVSFGSALRGASQASTFMSAELKATHTFRIPRESLNRQQASFDRTLGAELLEEVTLHAQVLMPTKESRPQVELDLSSQSGASKIEVATLVITGRYPNNVNAASSTQPATEVLLAPVLNLIERPLEDSLGLNLSLTPETGRAGLFIDLNKSFSRRLRLYARTPIGEVSDDTLQSFGVEYKLNNFLSSELTREQVNQTNATSGRLHLRLSWE